MNCRREWPAEVLCASLGTTFVWGPLKRHRDEQLLRREKALLPSSQCMVENYRTVQALESEERTLNRVYDELATRARTVRTTMNAVLDEIHADSYRVLHRITHVKASIDRIRNSGFKVGVGSSTVSHRRCAAADGCRGYLNSEWRCTTCDRLTCRSCLAIIASDDGGAPHACNPDDVRSAALVDLDSRPCPGCGSRIHRIDGCDQMWCTVCHTRFRYETGQIISSRVRFHNPHHQHWVSVGGYVPSDPRDEMCGGVDQEQVYAMTSVPHLRAKLRGMVRAMTATQDRLLTYYEPRTRRDEDAHADLRLSYLLGIIATDEEWMRALGHRDKARRVATAEREIFETFVAGVGDLLRNVTVNGDAYRAYEECESLHSTCNAALRRVHAAHNVVPSRRLPRLAAI